MTKREFSWLLVRIIGVCLMLNGCRYTFIVMENLLLVSKANNGETLLSQGSGLISGWAIEAVVSFIVGLYLIKDGGFLFRWLNYQPNEESSNEYNSGFMSIKPDDTETEKI